MTRKSESWLLMFVFEQKSVVTPLFSYQQGTTVVLQA
jgi:hypothetical protein